MPVMQTLTEQLVPVKIWTNDIDERAKRQLSNVASLPFIHHHVAAMPDVHVGMGATIGSVIATHKAIIPAAVGVDIPTIRSLGERQSGTMLRINPRHCWLHPGKGVSLEMGGLEALLLIEAEMKTKSF